MEEVNLQVFQAAAAIVGGNAQPGSRTTPALIAAELLPAYRALLDQARRIEAGEGAAPSQSGH